MNNIKMEKEITVEVTCSYEQLHKELIKNGFEIKEKFHMDDIYMISNEVDFAKYDRLEILKKCILVRNIIDIKKALLYKYKKYAINGDIIEQGKVECPIADINKAVDFMNSINYKTLFEIHDSSIVYANDRAELVVQIVNDKYIFIEMEDKGSYVDTTYDSIEELIKEIEKYNISYKKDNYFVKKALIVLNEII